MTTSAPASLKLPQWVAAIFLCAGSVSAQEGTAQQSVGEARPAAENPAPPAPSKNLVEQGGAWFLVRAVPTKPGLLATEEMERIGEAISRRVNPSGALDVQVTPHGDNQLYVEVPALALKAVDAARSALVKPGRLSFHLLGPDGLQGTTTVEDNAEKPGLLLLRYRESGRREKGAPSDKWLWVQQKPALSGDMVKSATHALQPGATSYSLSIELHHEAGDRMLRFTKAQLGKPLAIVVDGEALSAPVIQGEFGANFEITGHFTESGAAALAALLTHPLDHPVTISNSGTLPAKKP